MRQSTKDRDIIARYTEALRLISLGWLDDAGIADAERIERELFALERTEGDRRKAARYGAAAVQLREALSAL